MKTPTEEEILEAVTEKTPLESLKDEARAKSGFSTKHNPDHLLIYTFEAQRMIDRAHALGRNDAIQEVLNHLNSSEVAKAKEDEPENNGYDSAIRDLGKFLAEHLKN